MQKAALRSATSLTAFALLCASSAYAQDAAEPAAEAADDGGVIIVTGTRIQTDVPTTVAPVQVVSEDLIESSGAINIQETLLENPVFGTPTFSRTNTSFLTSGSGLATVDLRNLDVDRTLVLINGRRVVSGLPGSAAVDLNMIPTQMLERAEVLTSGSASAVYGSDAVAGVVNFILKDDFEGLEINAQSGITEVGDSFTLDTGVLLGGNFDDGRGNATVFFGYSEQGAAFLKNHKTEAGPSDVDSISAIFFGGDIFDSVEPFNSSYAPQGRYSTDNFTWTYSPTGALQPCFDANAATCTSDIGDGVGPNGFNRQAFRYLAVPVQRYTGYLNAHYDITDNITAFLEGSFVSTNAKSNIEPFPWDTDSSGTQYVDGQMPIETLFNGAIVRNPFVPDAIYNDASDTNGDGLRDIFVAKRLSSFGPRATEATQDTFRLVGGVRGELASNWNYEVFANYGQTNITQTGTGQINVLNFRSSQQIVPDGEGGFMCADPNAVANGCIPVNIFGLDSIGEEGVAYLEAPSFYKAVQKQTQVGANLSGFFGNPLGANDIGMTVGVEYRRESQDSRWDALQSAGLNGGNALPPTSGSFEVKEAYGEVLVPLINDGFVHELSVRGAARYSDYSSIGNTFSWNAGGEFAPIEDIRFRGMYAVTVRAPNVAELFEGLSQDFPTVNDPCDGIGATGGGALGDNCRAAPGVLANIAANGTFLVTQSDRQGVTGFSGGNPNLQEEKGKTLTAGVVINPKSIHALRNLTITADYFRVKIQDAIVETPEQFIVDQCYRQGVQSFCDFIERRTTQQGTNSAGSLREVNTGVTNSGGIKTSGIDVTLNYVHFFDVGNERLRTSLNVAYTHLLSGYEIPLRGEAKDYFEGEVGSAKDRFTVNTAIGTDDFRLSATGTYIGASWIDDQFDGFHVYKVHPEFYLDLQLRYFIEGGTEFYVGADNVLDNDPVYFASVNGSTTGMESDTGTYDPLGRRFYAGVKMKF
ncbi:TonB-dependent receptor [Novosphingobium endophyticum]|uniref:TonB-dependent receptor n=1 Tax=Novosphingobium endophyticum TaxID=1955250 RepID=A0A916X5H0_9SPHN|nr:TonB-dependent receptor [Novosphingobium endophyticum]GGB97352.1 TonB-dependent receptor [Novosphingobium endophyticum]